MSKDTIGPMSALIIIVAVGLFTVGYAFGVSAQKRYLCPEVHGGKVTQTIDSKEGQTCVYIPSKTLGVKTVKVTLK